LRLHFCNLTCGKLSGWKCDTAYTWNPDTPEFWQEPEDWSYQETVARIEVAWNECFGEDEDKRLVVTGGEPLIQQKKIVDLLKLLPEWQVEIETNGTIMPLEKLRRCQLNCSPKLKNSGNSLTRRYKPEVLRAINNWPISQFKFVVVEINDLNEIAMIAKECSLNKNKILIMPEGRTAEVVTEHEKLIQGKVIQRGWQITRRNQLIWYGAKRRT